ncbi:MAG: glycoside hydrolase family 88/105 protein, partial [Bacteroidota bacterium]
MRILQKYSLLIFIAVGILVPQQGTPLDVSRRVADKLIRETSFEFTLSVQKPDPFIQTIDWNRLSPDNGACYASSTFLSATDTMIILGVSHPGPLTVFVNGTPVYSQVKGTRDYLELAYDIYFFNSLITLPVQKGKNEILIKSLRSFAERSISLSVIDSAGRLQHPFPFSVSPYLDNDSVSHRWLLIGPFSSNGKEDPFTVKYPPENGFNALYSFQGKSYVWELPNEHVEMKPVIDEDASFRQHSYFEWHYANGQTALAVIALADATHDARYSDYVSKYCSVTMRMNGYFSRQYSSGLNKRGFNYRRSRLSMLDDTSAPILPFIELALRDSLKDVRTLIDSIAQFVTNEQTRLKDGTLCRMEPEPNTIWADDLFMSVPFLLRYAKLSEDEKYYDDAALQITNFHTYLFYKEKAICSHGWFGGRNSQSAACWGRANGWMIWAIAEALDYLPKNHREYKGIREIFRERIDGLVRYQGENGMWHQVLDHPETYEETSCTAMFVLSIARGVRNGWIDSKYRKYAERGWLALQQRIADDGTVSGICQGTD